MRTQILGTKNVLNDQTTSFHRRTNKIKNRPKPTKDKPPCSKKTNNDVKKSNLVNGQVTLLRRGESLSSIKFQEPVLKLIDTNKPVESQFLPHVPGFLFAGSGFVKSPSPRKLPVPSFLSREREDEVTKDLRRMLQLE